MTVPELQVSAEPPLSIPADVLVVGVVRGSDGPELLAENDAFGELRNTLAALGVTGATDELYRLAPIDCSAKSIALIGVGAAPITADSLRYAAGSATRQLTGSKRLLINLPTRGDAELLAVLEGAALGAYDYSSYRFKSESARPTPAETIVVHSDAANTTATVERARIVAQSVHNVRDLVNAPPSDLYPETFAKTVRELAAEHPVDVTVLEHDGLVAGGFGGILGVGQGSTRGPRLVKISYEPKNAAQHLAFVGKGITFDTGGISLKSPAGMVGMKYDMTGAATVMAVVLAGAKLGLPIRLTAWLCIAENMPSGSAIRPNDVLHMRGGRTVEVLNTDAEGRLVMADGLVAASEEFPDAIVDVATLTGAARVALGTRYAAVMGDSGLVTQVVAAAVASGELLWPMPLPAELRPLLNSEIADIANAKIGSTAGGMLLAGVFLREFIGTRKDDPATPIPWAHLDIAGPADNGGSGYGYTGKGATGVAVRALLHLAEEISHA